MGKDEKIVLILGGIGLAALVIYHVTQINSGPVETGMGFTEPENKVVPSGMANYMVYNQPYLFSPPVANILPSTASGILGQPYEAAPAASNADYENEHTYYN